MSGYRDTDTFQARRDRETNVLPLDEEDAMSRASNVIPFPVPSHTVLRMRVEKQNFALGAAREVERRRAELKQEHAKGILESSVRDWENEGGFNVR